MKIGDIYDGITKSSNIIQGSDVCSIFLYALAQYLIILFLS